MNLMIHTAIDALGITLFLSFFQLSQVSLKHPTKDELSMTDFFGNCDQIHSFPRIWSHLLKKPSMKNFIFSQ